MTATVDEIMVVNLEAEAALGQWDVPPSLDFIIRQPNGEVTMQDLEAPNSLWSSLPPHLVVTAIAAYIHAEGFPRELGPKDGEFIGVAIRTETWAFLGDGAFTDEEKAHFNELADLMERESIAGHPEAVEAKTIMALTIDGEPHMASLRRDTGAVMSYGGEAGGVADGRMLHALNHLLESFKEAFS